MLPAQTHSHFVKAYICIALISDSTLIRHGLACARCSWWLQPARKAQQLQPARGCQCYKVASLCICTAHAFFWSFWACVYRTVSCITCTPLLHFTTKLVRWRVMSSIVFLSVSEVTCAFEALHICEAHFLPVDAQVAPHDHTTQCVSDTHAHVRCTISQVGCCITQSIFTACTCCFHCFGGNFWLWPCYVGFDWGFRHFAFISFLG